jgi:hypothetical protein
MKESIRILIFTDVVVSKLRENIRIYIAYEQLNR